MVDKSRVRDVGVEFLIGLLHSICIDEHCHPGIVLTAFATK
jgi:hypothetical protein